MVPTNGGGGRRAPAIAEAEGEDSDGVLKIGAARHSEAQVIEADAVLVEAVATDCPVGIV